MSFPPFATQRPNGSQRGHGPLEQFHVEIMYAQVPFAEGNQFADQPIDLMPGCFAVKR